MNHFRRIAGDIDTSSIRRFLDQHPEIWNGWMDKHETPLVHGVKPRLVGPEMPFWQGIRDGRFRESIFLRWFAGAHKPMECAPEIASIANWAQDTVRAIATLVGATELGCVSLVALRAGERIWPHVDGPPECSRCKAAGVSMCQYVKRYPQRFHCVITSNPECMMHAGDEKVCMAPGELWWFNWRAEHSVVNAGDTDRIHLLFDAVVQ